MPVRNREIIWRTMAMCLLTTQQRSGPDSPINRFLQADPFSISLDQCEREMDVERFFFSELSKYDGIRFRPKIAKQMKDNYTSLCISVWFNIKTTPIGLSSNVSPNHLRIIMCRSVKPQLISVKLSKGLVPNSHAISGSRWG